MTQPGGKRSKHFESHSAPSGPGNCVADDHLMGAVHYRLVTGKAPRALATATGQLRAARRENEILQQKNEQLMRKLVSISRRAQTANRMAHRDVLTGLPNRLLLVKRLQRAIADAFQRQTQLALMFIDLDGFKAVNDRYGHKVGDRLLAVVASRIAGSVRADDIACRYGGDEFVTLVANIDDPVIATRISQQILENISRRYCIDGHVIHITASIGIAIYPADGERYDELLSHADAKMYRSKAAPRTLCALPAESTAAGLESRNR